MKFELKTLSASDIAAINLDVSNLISQDGRPWYLNEAADLHRRWMSDAVTGDYLVEGHGGVVTTDDLRVPYNFKCGARLYQIFANPPFDSTIIVLGATDLTEHDLKALAVRMREAFGIFGYQGEGDTSGTFAQLSLEVA